jgi:hypothetical protein
MFSCLAASDGIGDLFHRSSKNLMLGIRVRIDISFYNVISTNIILVARRVAGSGDARKLCICFRRAPLRLAPSESPASWRRQAR